MRVISLKILTMIGIVAGATGSIVSGAVAPHGAHSAAAVEASAPRGVDDFSFSSFDADYTLGRDEAGHSLLHTKETLVAQFPDFDQNRGIRRAIPLDYDGHPTELDVISVTDGEGAPRDYESESDDGFELITIAGDEYVRGEQTYVIEYEQRNVTAYFADTDADEFQWDVNGTEWAQPFGSVTARVNVPDELATALTGGIDCSWGPAGSRDSCLIETMPGDGETVITASQADLGPGENVTIAIGFDGGTFTPRDSSFWASGFAPLFLFGMAALLATLIAAILVRLGPAADARGRATIVAEYLPPAEPELPVLAVIAGKSGRAVAATLVSFAVRGIARIVDVGAGYELEYRGEGKPIRARATAGLGAVERAIAVSFFGQVFEPGERADLSSADEKIALSVSAALTKARAAAESERYRRPIPIGPVLIVLILAFVALVALFVSGIGLLEEQRGGAISGIAIALAFLAVVPTLFIFRHPLTDRGAEARDHLKGLERYLKLAEEERLRLLQSVTGAERRSDGASLSDPAADGEGGVVRLYERLLPYAVLLGIEKSWSEVLGEAYAREGGEPDWYRSSGGFNAVAFASGVGSFSGSATSHYSGSVSSSSSGGSTGGSFSGGGGGGGGGGGV